MKAMFENSLVIGNSFVKRLKDYHLQRFQCSNFWVSGSPVIACVWFSYNDIGTTLIVTGTDLFSVGSE